MSQNNDRRQVFNMLISLRIVLLKPNRIENDAKLSAVYVVCRSTLPTRDRAPPGAIYISPKPVFIDRLRAIMNNRVTH